MTLITKLEFVPWDELDPVLEISVIQHIAWFVFIKLFFVRLFERPMPGFKQLAKLTKTHFETSFFTYSLVFT
jgi:hypothetical protein